jgi:hypothetical protein
MGQRRNRRITSPSGLLVLAGLAIVLIVVSATQAARVGGNAAAPEGSLVPSTGEGGLPAVDSFSAFALRQAVDSDQLLPSITEGLRLLKAAVSSIEQRERPFAAAQRTLEDAPEGSTASEARSEYERPGPVLAELNDQAEVIARLQRDRFAHLERAAAELQRAASAIHADVPLTLQTKALERYFERASDVLRAMAEMKS